MDRKLTLASAAGPATAADTARARQAEVTRRRVRLMIEITARAGTYRKGLLSAVKHLSPEEAAIVSDLERYGLQVPQLQDVLRGGHVLEDELFQVSLRIREHHAECVRRVCCPGHSRQFDREGASRRRGNQRQL